MTRRKTRAAPPGPPQEAVREPATVPALILVDGLAEGVRGAVVRLTAARLSELEADKRARHATSREIALAG